MSRRRFLANAVVLFFWLVVLSPMAGVFADDAASQSWVGTWSGTISTLDSNSGKPVSSPYSVVIAQADIGKTWTVLSNSIAKSESVAGVRSSTILTRTGPDTCSLSADGVASGRGGFTRHVTGDLTRK